jgi:hypothetical protein
VKASSPGQSEVAGSGAWQARIAERPAASVTFGRSGPHIGASVAGMSLDALAFDIPVIQVPAFPSEHFPLVDVAALPGQRGAEAGSDGERAQSKSVASHDPSTPAWCVGDCDSVM